MHVHQEFAGIRRKFRMLIVWQERLEKLVAGSTDYLNRTLAVYAVVYGIDGVQGRRATHIPYSIVMEHLIQRVFLGTICQQLAV